MRVFGISGLADINSERLSVRTIPLSGLTNRCYHYTPPPTVFYSTVTTKYNKKRLRTRVLWGNGKDDKNAIINNWSFSVFKMEL